MSTTEQFNDAMRQWVEFFFRRSMRELQLFMKKNELNMGQYSALMRLFHDPNCGVTDLGTQIGISNAAASQLVDKLVQQDLVERTEAQHDRRMKQLTLTQRGRTLMDDSIRARMSWTQDLAEALPPERRKVVIETLQEVISVARGLDAVEPELSKP